MKAGARPKPQHLQCLLASLHLRPQSRDSGLDLLISPPKDKQQQHHRAFHCSQAAIPPARKSQAPLHPDGGAQEPVHLPHASPRTCQAQETHRKTQAAGGTQGTAIPVSLLRKARGLSPRSAGPSSRWGGFSSSSAPPSSSGQVLTRRPRDGCVRKSLSTEEFRVPAARLLISRISSPAFRPANARWKNV